MQLFPQSPRQWRYPEANAGRSVAFGLAWPASVPGTDNGGPDAHELAAVRRLHAEGLALRLPA